MSLLPASTIRALGQKEYEKRKQAALEVEAHVRELRDAQQYEKINAIVKHLALELANSAQAHVRKGALHALSGTAIGLRQHAGQMLPQLLPPVLSALSDPDPRVRYTACEALYNIAKVARSSCVAHINEIFDGLFKLSADTDVQVQNGMQLLDRLMKDVVTESEAFDLAAFMPLLGERIYVSNPFSRQFLVGWISTLGSVPDLDLVAHLPVFLDGLFHMLADANREIRTQTFDALNQLLREIGEAEEVPPGSGGLRAALPRPRHALLLARQVHHTHLPLLAPPAHLARAGPDAPLLCARPQRRPFEPLAPRGGAARGGGARRHLAARSAAPVQRSAVRDGHRAARAGGAPLLRLRAHPARRAAVGAHAVAQERGERARARAAAVASSLQVPRQPVRRGRPARARGARQDGGRPRPALGAALGAARRRSVEPQAAGRRRPRRDGPHGRLLRPAARATARRAAAARAARPADRGGALRDARAARHLRDARARPHVGGGPRLRVADGAGAQRARADVGGGARAPLAAAQGGRHRRGRRALPHALPRLVPQPGLALVDVPRRAGVRARR
mmetsp:Transcript_45662/g.152314  ORF Transcript_45662/g.152314 Transcript_45662/m.152314 type:complete len:565 (+) Transcript_45662:45-1739(+)